MAPTTNVAKTDEEVKTEVVEELRWDSGVDASKVQVEVDDGVVKLSGHVPSWGGHCRRQRCLVGAGRDQREERPRRRAGGGPGGPE
ncbi:MAG: BON domain-containing protein [Planctomycetota bacterium]